MRLTIIMLAPLLLALPASAFDDGPPTFKQLDAPQSLPGDGRAAEPTLGIPWNTDSIFYMAFEEVYRIRVDENGTASWDAVTPPNSILNVDPMLHADPDLGRVWAGGLDGPCSIMAYSDDDGETWIPTGNMCSGVQFDHQSIGSGPHALLPESPTFAHMTYYCAQLITMACASSSDGGLTWGAPVQVLPPCGGLHGHIRVSRITGMAAVPDRTCGGEAGFGYTENDGLTWQSRTVEGSSTGRGFDPSLAFGRDQGWLWYGLGNVDGASIALSKDDGRTWEAIGGGMGENTTWLDVGQFHDPPVVRATFSDVRVGDDDRVAFAFLGLEDLDGDGQGSEYPSNVNQCTEDQEIMVWHYYVALSYDAGSTWEVVQATEDPVQVGGIWDLGGGAPCRNLLDFNDMDIDSEGRLYIGFADGCTRECATTNETETDGYRDRQASLLRQTGGKGLFAAFDPQEQAPTTSPGETDTHDEDASYATLGLFVGGLLAAVAVARRR